MNQAGFLKGTVSKMFWAALEVHSLSELAAGCTQHQGVPIGKRFECSLNVLLASWQLNRSVASPRWCLFYLCRWRHSPNRVLASRIRCWTGSPAETIFVINHAQSLHCYSMSDVARPSEEEMGASTVYPSANLIPTIIFTALLLDKKQWAGLLKKHLKSKVDQLIKSLY